MKQENQQPNYHYQNDDEITLKEFFLTIKRYFLEIWALRKWVTVVSVIAAILFGIFAILSTPTYPAKLTFMVNEDEGQSGGAITGLLSGLGLGGAKSEYNLAKIMELSRSRRIIGDALLEKVTIDSSNDFYANHLIKLYDLWEEWEDSEIGLQKFMFTHDSIPAFNLAENAALKATISKIVGNPKENIPGLMTPTFSEETAILQLTVESESEAFSVYFTNVLYEKLSNFYIEKSIEKQISTYKIIEAKVDSLNDVMNRKQYALLNFQDSNNALTLRRSEAQKMRLEKELQITAIAYGEAVKNLELSDFSLKNATPFFQTIDKPVSPLDPIKSSLLKNLIIGAILGGFLSGIYIILKVMFTELFQED